MKATVTPVKGSSEELLSRLKYKDLYLPALAKMGEHRKREWLTVRLLLKEMLGEEKQILYTDAGKPYLADHSSHISISHTRGYVAVVTDEKHPVAIDIEHIAPRVEKIRSRFMSEAEEQHLSSCNPLIHLLLHWSAKETLFKLLDENTIEFKSQLHILPFEPVTGEWADFNAYETVTGKQQTFTIRYIVTPDYVLTQCQCADACYCASRSLAHCLLPHL
jgi:4'-phosphopantetheinyl transferase EntD